ncbi:hypothetical protein MASR1M48_17450 [Lactococcus petauri]
MSEDLSPEIRIGEIPPKVRTIKGASTSTFATVGLFEKGPIGVPTFVSGPEELAQKFGREIGPYLGRRSLGRAFSNGTSRGYVTRTAHYTDITDKTTLTALKAKIQIDDRLVNAGLKAKGTIKVANNAIEEWIQAQGYIEIINNVFDVGDKVTINGVDFTEGVEFSAGVNPAATALALAGAINSSINISIQGVVTASIDPNNSARVLITAVVYGTSGNTIPLAETDGATDNFTLSGATLAGGVNGDTLTVDATTFKFGDDILLGGSAAATAAAIQAAVNALVGITAVVNALDTAQVDVEYDTVGIAGNAIVLSKVDADNDLALSGAGTLTGGQDTDALFACTVEAADGEGTHANGRIIVISNARNGLADHFKIEVKDSTGSVVLDVFDNVNLIPASANYAETRINGKQQKLIKFVDEFSTNTVGNKHLPLIGTFVMIGGNDGLVGLVDLDFIGDPTQKNGIYSWDLIEDKFALSLIPDRPTPIVQKFAQDYATIKKTFLHIVDAPDLLSPQQVVSWLEDNGLGTEYGDFSYPWLVIQDRAPGAGGAELRIPNSGAMIGLHARTDNAVGKGVAKLSAGVNDGRIFDIVGPADNAYQEKANRDLIFVAGINPIWSEQGVGTIRDGGVLTKQDGLVRNVNERRVFIYTETSVKLGIRFARHENIDEKLYNAINATISLFLTTFWRQGGLKGKTPDEAFYVNTDFGAGTINPPSEQEAQRVNVEVGLATKKPNYYTTINFTVDQRALLAELGQ